MSSPPGLRPMPGMLGPWGLQHPLGPIRPRWWVVGKAECAGPYSPMKGPRLMMVSDLPTEWEAEPAQAPRCPVPGWGSYHSLRGLLTGGPRRALSTKGTGIPQAQWDASLSWTPGKMQLSSQGPSEPHCSASAGHPGRQGLGCSVAPTQCIAAWMFVE